MNNGTITCIECKAPFPFWGSPDPAKQAKALQRIGFRQVGGGWMCFLCTGILESNVRDLPEDEP